MLILGVLATTAPDVGAIAVTLPAEATVHNGAAVLPLTEAPPAVTMNVVPVTERVILGVMIVGSNALTRGVSAAKKSPP